MRILIRYILITLSIFLIGNNYAQEVSKNYTNHSVLSQGKWYKVGVSKDGIYKITYNDLDEMGFNMSSLKPENIQLFGNGGGLLSENILAERIDDLSENSIYVYGQNDGSFDANDYILFYGHGPIRWNYNDSDAQYYHQTNYYSDKSFYFITVANTLGKRIETATNINIAPTNSYTTFTELKIHELNENNLVGSGRIWYGEKFDFETNYTFEFNSAHLLSSGHTIRTGLAARSTSQSTFSVNINNTTYSHLIGAVSFGENSDYARTQYKSLDWNGTSSQINVSISNDDVSGNTIGWIDFIELNIQRKIKMNTNELIFHAPANITLEEISEYKVDNTNSSTQIWDISNPIDAKKINGNYQSGITSIKHINKEVNEFIAFNGNDFASPELIKKVANQDLHGNTDVDYLIISHPLFFDQAARLADFHYQNSNMPYVIVSPEEIYNEFSSGCQDISAIRDYIKMIYESRNDDNGILYVLLMGDGSYDYMDVLEDNTNYIPTWQSYESLHAIKSYTTDDFFALVNDNQKDESDLIDVGIGRIPVSSAQQAEDVVNKILHYCSENIEVMNDWRNMICFVADDEDSNSHTSRANQLAGYIESFHPEFNLDKIYIDAFEQISSPSGQSYPEAKQAIDNRIKDGALIINYTGHGGEDGWAHEKILHTTDINNWKNFNHQPVFVTATCEFSRFDDPRRTSAGELVLLNPEGGGSALFTTTRATYGYPNQNLNLSFYKFAFNKNENGEHYRLGDLIYLSKRDINGDFNARKFVLLGDPAMKMAYPDYQVKTNSIHNLTSDIANDTLRALQEIKITGEITEDDNLVSDFNGSINIKIFDKETLLSTKGNDDTTPYVYRERNNVLYNGTSIVQNGLFEVIFIVPKDIAYRYGEGKISYYAEANGKDASGFDNSIIIGGYGDEIYLDEQGPNVQLFMNDPYFVNGGITNENPTLYAVIEDESGINTIGTGIGHDITLTINDDSDNQIIINQFYQAELGNYKKGNITYPLYNLADGEYTVCLKIWDNNNNSTDAKLNFTVYTGDQLKIDNSYNYPNPFNEFTQIVFEHNQTSKEIDVDIQIFDIQGRLIKNMIFQSKTNGYVSQAYRWDGTNNSGSKLENGIYLYRIIVTNDEDQKASLTKKLILIK